MHMSLAAAANPFKATTVWRENTNGPGHVLFLHIGGELTLLMSLDELLSLHLVLAAAIDDSPVAIEGAAAAAH
jgi:hypothetical protein